MSFHVIHRQCDANLRYNQRYYGNFKAHTPPPILGNGFRDSKLNFEKLYTRIKFCAPHNSDALVANIYVTKLIFMLYEG